MKDVEQIKNELKETFDYCENKRKRHLLMRNIMIFVILLLIAITVLFISNYTGESILNAGSITFIFISLCFIYIPFYLAPLNYKRTLAKNFFPKIVSSISKNSSYIKRDRKLLSQIEKMGIFKMANLDTSDMITEKYNGVNYKVSNLNVTKSSGKSSVTIFSGLWYSFDFETKTEGTLQILENRELIDNLINGLKKYETESLEFNDKFEILSDNENLVYEILTQGMIQRIIDFEKDKIGSVYIIYKAGTLHVGINKMEGSFKINIKESIYKSNFIEKIIKQIKIAENIIDDLNIDKDLLN